MVEGLKGWVLVSLSICVGNCVVEKKDLGILEIEAWKFI
jgi:hypothetical protein